MMTRREWIAGAAALPALAGPKYSPKLAAQVYVWTQQFDRQKKSYVDGAPEMIAASKAAGYRRLEIMQQILVPQVKDALAAAGIEIPIVYVGGTFHTEETGKKAVADVLEAARTAKEFGARYINTNPSPKPQGERKSDGELATEAKYVDQLAHELSKTGMRLLIHHHDPEMKENAREWRYLLQHTDAKASGLCLDIDWIFQGGQQALALLEEAGSRVESLHLRNAAGGVWTESLGEGDYDYKAVAALLKKRGYQGYLVVELAHRPTTKITRSLEENLRLSREFAEKTFGVKA